MKTTGEHRSLSILVHADTKVGKSTFANTAPAPRLLLDAEAAARFLPGRKVMWDPMTEQPPKADGSWDTCVVNVRDYSIMLKAYEWLNSGQHEFRSVIIDSISEVQTRVKEQLEGEGRMTQQLWGDLLNSMERLIRGFRDLTEHPIRPLEAVVLTAMTQMRDGKYRPYVQGQLQIKMPYFLDVIGYLYIEEQPVDPEDPTKGTRKIRKMLVVPHVQFEAGERVQGRLGDIITEPNVCDMIDRVFGPLPEAQKNKKQAK
nr:MAG TPA: AAA domain protein [Caudoviricetes sp.]